MTTVSLRGPVNRGIRGAVKQRFGDVAAYVAQEWSYGFFSRLEVVTLFVGTIALCIFLCMTILNGLGFVDSDKVPARKSRPGSRKRKDDGAPMLL